MTFLKRAMGGLLISTLCSAHSSKVEGSTPISFSAEGRISFHQHLEEAGFSTVNQSNLRKAYDAARHQIRKIDGNDQFTALNLGQQWNILFDHDGFLVTPLDSCSKGTATWQWGLTLKSYGRVGDQRQVAQSEGNSTSEGQKLIFHRDAVVDEWYINDRGGLEHGFVIHKRPESDQVDSSLKLTLQTRGNLSPKVSSNGKDVAFLDAQGSARLNYSGLKVWDADDQNLIAYFEETRDQTLHLVVDDRNARYPITIDPVAQQAYFKASNSGRSDVFGTAVAVSGNTVVVGAPAEASSARGVNGDQSADDATSSGAVYVFVQEEGSWRQQAYLKASNSDMGDRFGQSVAIDGDTLVVGAHEEDSNATGVNGDTSNNDALKAGAVYVFVRSEGSWSEQAYLKASNTGLFDDFGISVSIDRDTLVVGAQIESSAATGVNGDESNDMAFGAGAAYVFTRSGTTWSQEAYLKASNTESSDGFGRSVSVSGDYIIVGAAAEDSAGRGIDADQTNNDAERSGAAYIFERSGGVWTQQAFLKASNAGEDDRFGNSVFLSGNTAVVGAPSEKSAATGINGEQDDDSLNAAGAVYLFERIDGTWTQQAYLKASNTDENDRFGIAVALFGERLVVGASGEASPDFGINGFQNLNGSANSGAAYYFIKSNGEWSQQAYIKSSNTNPEDRFGSSVAVSEDFLVIGAIWEDSDADGVNGDQFDNDAGSSGAVYLFSPTSAASVFWNEPAITIEAGQPRLSATGVAGASYRVQRSSSLEPDSWIDVEVVTAGQNGLIEVIIANPPPNEFYRIVN